jgi:hypothetical protein
MTTQRMTTLRVWFRRRRVSLHAAESPHQPPRSPG